MKLSALLAGGLALAASSSLPLASAHGSYRSNLPNGYLVSQSAYGHSSQSSPGNGNVNEFGSNLNSQSLTWTRWLCTRDSDGDGFTNGFEMGDPCCVWSRGNSPAYTSDIGNPGNAAVRPTVRNCSRVSCSNGVDPCVATSTGGAGAVEVGAAVLAAVALATAMGAVSGVGGQETE